MNAFKVHERQRLRLTVLSAGDYWGPEVLDEDHIALRRFPSRQRPVKLTKTEALKAIGKSRLCFTQSWDQLREKSRT